MREIPVRFQLNVPIQPQTNHYQQTSMLTRHFLSYILYMQLTVTIMITLLSHTLLTTVLRSCYILISSRWHSLSVSIKIDTRPLSTMGENSCTLESMVSYHYPPAFKTRQAKKAIFGLII